MMKKIDRSKSVHFKLHVDHLDNKDEDVWALSWQVGRRKKYVTLHRVFCSAPVLTIFHGSKTEQPRAYLLGFGTVEITRTGKRRYARIV